MTAFGARGEQRPAKARKALVSQGLGDGGEVEARKG
jgi:hypothetical protein